MNSANLSGHFGTENWCTASTNLVSRMACRMAHTTNVNAFIGIYMGQFVLSRISYGMQLYTCSVACSTSFHGSAVFRFTVWDKRHIIRSYMPYSMPYSSVNALSKALSKKCNLGLPWELLYTMICVWLWRWRSESCLRDTSNFDLSRHELQYFKWNLSIWAIAFELVNSVHLSYLQIANSLTHWDHCVN